MKSNNLITLDSKEGIGIYDVFDYEGCKKIKESTSARVCVGRCGARYRTETFLRFRASHVSALNAVCSSGNEAVFECLGFIKIQTGTEIKEDTLTFIKNVCEEAPDVQIIVSGSFISPIVTRNVREVYSIILKGIKSKKYKIGTPILIKNEKKVIIDRLSKVIKAKITILLISNKYGSDAAEGISCFITYNDNLNKCEFEGMIISNIHSNGTSPVKAGKEIVNKINELMKEELNI